MTVVDGDAEPDYDTMTVGRDALKEGDYYRLRAFVDPRPTAFWPIPPTGLQHQPTSRVHAAIVQPRPVPPTFKRGDAVEVAVGPYLGRTGWVTGIDGKVLVVNVTSAWQSDDREDFIVYLFPADCAPLDRLDYTPPDGICADAPPEAARYCACKAENDTAMIELDRLENGTIAVEGFPITADQAAYLARFLTS